MRLGCGFRQPNFVPKFRASVIGIGPYALRGDEGRHAGSSCPTGGCGEPPRLPWVAAHSGASAAQTGGTGGNRGRDHPKSVQQRRTIPQSRLRRASSLCTREPLWTWESVLFTMDDGRGFGPPHERRGERHAESSCPTESPINHPSQPARSEASAPAAARDGRESTQGPSQKGDRPRNRPGSA